MTKSEIRTEINKNRLEVNKLLKEKNRNFKDYALNMRKIKGLVKRNNNLKKKLKGE